MPAQLRASVIEHERQAGIGNDDIGPSPALTRLRVFPDVSEPLWSPAGAFLHRPDRARVHFSLSAGSLAFIFILVVSNLSNGRVLC
mmetsp:Transcript_27554/g.91458  ORF Transcript_27554/g.91458 Transcript_27554/m.91458 type:complete len:86 (+) Transcript_27554:1990-2247(+)